MKALLQYVNQEKDRFIKELIAFLRIPSVSTNPGHKNDILECASFVSREFESIGLDRVEIFTTQGNPIVYGEWMRLPGKPTILIYGHYDVQPPDPLEEWITPPFEPSLREGKIFARGAEDNKGNIFLCLKAVEAYLRVNNSLPVNVKFFIEGEEESGSKNSQEFIESHKELLKANVIVNTDAGGIKKDGTPEINVGLRGICYFQLDLVGSNHDLHSGTYGGVVANPLFILVHLLAKCKDERTGKVLIPGFYDDVQPITESERQILDRISFNEEDFKDGIGAPELFGEEGFTALERKGFRPTFEIHGILGGYTGEGLKTVIPARAMAKVSIRLVPKQDPQKIAVLFENYLRKICPPTARLEIKLIGGMAKPWRTALDNYYLQVAARVLRKVFRKKPLFDWAGGTVGIIPEFSQTLKIPVISMGFGFENGNSHAPNENFDLYNFSKGIKSIIYFLEELEKNPGI